MSIRFRPTLFAWLLPLVFSVSASAAIDQGEHLNQQFQDAVAQYDAGHLTEAAAQLEALVRSVPESFEVHELLGLVYASQSRDELANQHLEKAVHLKPDSAAARTNLAANLVRMGKLDQAQVHLKRALLLEPQSYDANHDLGELYVRLGKLSDAIPFLKRAQHIQPSSYDNGYDLALAYLDTGRAAQARPIVQDLLHSKDTAELHNLLGQIDEMDGKFVDAVREFEAAAHQDPSESNLFDWASELLLHQTLEPAIEVFRSAAERFPKSPRISIGLGIALYSRGFYDEAVNSLLRAADLNPSDPRCYLFLSKAYDSSPSQADDVIRRFQRFAELQPDDARAPYYYAMSLWKGRRAQDPGLDLERIEGLLKKSITRDPKFSPAHLQLGTLYSEQGRYAEAIPQYERALANDPNLADAHYRLGQAYVHTAEKEKAQAQFEVYQKLRAQQMADRDKQRVEIRQFIYSEKDSKEETAAKP